MFRDFHLKHPGMRKKGRRNAARAGRALERNGFALRFSGLVLCCVFWLAIHTLQPGRMNFSDEHGHVRFGFPFADFLVVLASTELAGDEDAFTLFERLGEVGQLAPYNDSGPIRARGVIAAFFVFPRIVYCH